MTFYAWRRWFEAKQQDKERAPAEMCDAPLADRAQGIAACYAIQGACLLRDSPIGRVANELVSRSEQPASHHLEARDDKLTLRSHRTM